MGDEGPSPAPPADGEYLAQHVREALARDPRVAELGISVTVEPGEVYLSGEVTTGERRHAIVTVAREVLPGHQIRDQVTVTPLGQPDDMETLS
ncbi:MAG: BON domain-containing protein [Actinomycetota bacterium]|nr:BON domain-containing protein [Actinomycetota bacterium]